MAEQNGKVLFITPGASSAGGNKFLLNFLKWFRQNSEIPFSLLYGYGGDIEKDFREIAKDIYKFYPENDFGGFARKAVAGIAKHFKINENAIKAKIRRDNIKLIYSNSVINRELLSLVSGLSVPVVSHCHELETVIQMCGIDEFKKVKARTSHFVAVSDSVRRNLIENHDLPDKMIEVIDEFVPVEDLSEEQIRSNSVFVRRKFGIPENAFLVGGSGTLNWRKAPEIFIQTAYALSKKLPDAPIYFLWIGGAEAGDFSLFEAKFDVNKLGLERRVFFLEHQKDPMVYYSALDVFTLVSREEPFGLVCLEAASAGKPVICFENSGGSEEFVENGCGFTVPYLDTDRLAEKIIELYQDRELVSLTGARAAAKVREKYDISHLAPRMVDIIGRFMNRKA